MVVGIAGTFRLRSTPTSSPHRPAQSGCPSAVACGAEGRRNLVVVPCACAQHRPPLRPQSCRPLPLLIELSRHKSLSLSKTKERSINTKWRIGESHNLFACNCSSLCGSSDVIRPSSSFPQGRSQLLPATSHSRRHTAKPQPLSPSTPLRHRHDPTSIHCALITLRLIPNRIPPPSKWLLCTLSPAARSDRTSYVTPEHLREKFDPPPQ